MDKLRTRKTSGGEGASGAATAPVAKKSPKKERSGSFAPKAAIAVVLLLVALIAFATFLGQAGLVDMQTKEQGAESLRQSIIDAAIQCYAIEGSYPQSLDYLKDNYGVVVGDGYSVVYEAYAPNEMPTVIVGDAA